MGITTDFLCLEIDQQSYEISLHADDERIADSLTIEQLEYVLLNSEMLEQYPDDPRGESCLVLGFMPDGRVVHVVCGLNSNGHLFIVTVYIPSEPKWIDPYTRNR